MNALRPWIVVIALALVLPVLGAPLWLTVLGAAPFAALAGWRLAEPSHVCGWCGRRFTGPYEWCCPDCERRVP